MAGISKNIYWDTNIFYAYLKGEVHRDGEIDAIRAMADEFDKGLLGIFTSTVTVVEILYGKLAPHEKQGFDQMTRRSNFNYIEVSPAVAREAATVREDTARKDASGGIGLSLSAPDAIHVASAGLIGGLDQLVTLDTRNKPKHELLAMTAVSDYAKKKYQLIVARPDVRGQISLLGSEQSDAGQ